MTNELATALDRLLEARCSPATVRRIEDGAAWGALWEELEASGFASALVPEAQDGAGLSLVDAFPFLVACGRSALPLPLGPTLLARGALGGAGIRIPTGPVAIAPRSEVVEGGLRCETVPFGATAEWVLVQREAGAALLSINGAVVSPAPGGGRIDADLWWRSEPRQTVHIGGTLDVRLLGACVLAAQLAGAMDRILALSLCWASEREQFGRPVGRFQAVQQQLAVLAEHVAAARIAAQLGCWSPTHLPVRNLVAVAKARASEAAVPVAAIAHALHGAMGIAAEHELQLFTRRLGTWRMAFGSEGYWNRWLGAQLVTSGQDMVEFVRTTLSA